MRLFEQQLQQFFIYRRMISGDVREHKGSLFINTVCSAWNDCRNTGTVYTRMTHFPCSCTHCIDENIAPRTIGHAASLTIHEGWRCMLRQSAVNSPAKTPRRIYTVPLTSAIVRVHTSSILNDFFCVYAVHLSGVLCTLRSMNRCSRSCMADWLIYIRTTAHEP